MHRGPATLAALAATVTVAGLLACGGNEAHPSSGAGATFTGRRAPRSAVQVGAGARVLRLLGSSDGRSYLETCGSHSFSLGGFHEPDDPFFEHFWVAPITADDRVAWVTGIFGSLAVGPTGIISAWKKVVDHDPWTGHATWATPILQTGASIEAASLADGSWLIVEDGASAILVTPSGAVGARYDLPLIMGPFVVAANGAIYAVGGVPGGGEDFVTKLGVAFEPQWRAPLPLGGGRVLAVDALGQAVAGGNAGEDAQIVGYGIDGRVRWRRDFHVRSGATIVVSDLASEDAIHVAVLLTATSSVDVGGTIVGRDDVSSRLVLGLEADTGRVVWYDELPSDRRGLHDGDATAYDADAALAMGPAGDVVVTYDDAPCSDDDCGGCVDGTTGLWVARYDR